MAFGAVAAIVLWTTFGATLGAHPDQAIDAGREALTPWWGYPWYDQATDGVRPIEVVEPWRPPNLLAWLGLSLASLEKLLLWLVWVVLALVLLWVLYLVWRSARRRAGSMGLARQTDTSHLATPRQIESLPVPVSPERADLLGWVERCYSEGDYSRAVVYLFSYQLVALDRRQLIHLARGKTNRQYLRELAARTRLRDLVGHTMQVFEEVFFGNRRLDRSGFETCWYRLDEFHRLVGFGD